MGQTLTTPEKIIKLSKAGDYAELKDLLVGLQRHEPDYQRNKARYLEVEKEDGSTPLTLAAERGHYQIVELLLQQGAYIHHMNRKGDGGSPLHEAVAHRAEAVVDLLLRNGGNPLVENMKGFTAMDIACADKNVTLLRHTEQAAVFRGWLQMKVPRFGGLGSEWQRRWCVICHRYPYPGAPSSRQVTHLVFLAYRSTNSTVPACRVWLDGARAAEVFNPKAIARITAQGAGPAQIGLTLHRKHDPPVGAFYTGNLGEGYTLFFRPDDGSAQSVASLSLFTELVNHKGVRLPPGQQGQYSPPVTPINAVTPGSSGTPTPRPTTGTGGGAPGDWQQQFQPLSQAAAAANATIPAYPSVLNNDDEEYARRLQAQYDAEAAGLAAPPPPPPAPAAAPAAPPVAAQDGPYPIIVPVPGRPPVPQQQGGHPVPFPAIYPDQGTASYPAQAQQERPEQAYPSFSEPSSTQPSQSQGQLHLLDRVESVGAPSAPPLIDFGALGPMSAPPQPWWDAASEPGSCINSFGAHPSQAPGGQAPVPPPTSQQQPPAPAAAAGAAAAAAAATAGAGERDDDSKTCVICMEEEATSGFLHGDSVHRCLCRSCAAYMKQSNVTTCPMCRQTATAIINVF